MTIDKKLKGLIRARMAKTGESYAAARMQVLELRGGEVSEDVDAPVGVPGTAAAAPEQAQAPDEAQPRRQAPFADEASASELAWGFTERVARDPAGYVYPGRQIRIVAADLGPALLAVKTTFGGYAVLTPHLQPSGSRHADSLSDLTRRFRLSLEGFRAEARTLEDVDDMMVHTPRDQELLVAERDPECGPYSVAVRVPKAEVEARCKAGYRAITGEEVDAMIGEAEDFTAGWTHSE
jgi:hypothetical protein